MRALAVHGDKLEQIYLIGSDGPNGSQPHLETFAQIVRCYREAIPIRWGEAVDFEDIEAIYKRALVFIAEAEDAERPSGHSNGGYRQDEIIIDATGGLKTASIAAGLVTLHNRVKFQYVWPPAPHQAIGKQAGIKDAACVHALRRSFAVQMLRNGANVFSVQAMLGHTNLQQTRKYCALALADSEAQHRRFGPMDRLIAFQG